MKLLKPALAVAFLFGTFVCSNAWADPRGGGRHHRHHHQHHHGRAHLGFYFGAPLAWPGYWRHDPFYAPFHDPFYYRYRDPVILRPPPPPVYIERMPAPAPGAQFWYFCHNPQGYYPYVRECDVQWQAVAPDSLKPPEVR